jgi:GDP-L-fucose synthase
VSIKAVADAIVKAVGFEGEYSVGDPQRLVACTDGRQFDTSRPDGQFRKPASNAKLLRLIGGFEFTPFDKGTCVRCLLKGR